jgi:glycosyltransferase involved in cell wall biosynthesis
VAELCRNDGVDVKFTLVGDMGDALGSECREYCDCIGVLTDPLKMQRLYQDAHILLLVSSREGFPLVIMEAMANGVVPISTNVGGIGQHLDNGHNGILIDELTEDAITLSIRQAMESLSDRERLQQMSQAAYAYARQHFDNPDFCKCYKEVICGVNQFSQKTV